MAAKSSTCARRVSRQVAAHLLTGQENSDIVDGKLRPDAPEAQLYDLAADPAEAQNLYRDEPERVAAMRARLAELVGSKRTAPAR